MGNYVLKKQVEEIMTAAVIERIKELGINKCEAVAMRDGTVAIRLINTEASVVLFEEDIATTIETIILAACDACDITDITHCDPEEGSA